MAATVAATVAATLAVAFGAWVVSVERMQGMDMGPGTSLGSFGFFAGTWAVMMAAMMLPSAVPAVVSFGRLTTSLPSAVGRWVRFVAGYLAIWELVGIVSFAVYGQITPPGLGGFGWPGLGSVLAGSAVVVAGIYQLTPLKRGCLERCREQSGRRPPGAVTAGSRYGVDCLGSSAGPMVVLFALGAMSVTWMVVATVLVFAERVPRVGSSLVVPIAVVLIGLGLWVALDPSAVPGLVAPM
ncbi:MAG: DUF2182 domain-containing protein [Nocardioidaceae bacterium]